MSHSQYHLLGQDLKLHPEVRKILDNTIVLISICQNPDGRIADTRANANRFDLNRDFVTQSQPETRALVEQIVRWNPMILLDLHGFVNPMLIEPCTPPHNPNYEYDLYIKWALNQAIAMGEAVVANTVFTNYQIPYRDRVSGWDDYPPIFTAMYAMYHGAFAHTLETPVRSDDGVSALYFASMAAASFAAENKIEMFHDQIEIFRRGITFWVPQERFPAAYIIPAGYDNQIHPLHAARAVDFLLFNDIEVHRAVRPFTAGGVSYPAGTYVVLMNQPKRGLANTLLWFGEDISFDIDIMYDISAWNLPELWGFNRAAVYEPVNARLVRVNKADYPKGSIPSRANFYVIPNNTNNAIIAVNKLLEMGVPVSMAEGVIGGFGAAAFVIPASGNNQIMGELAREYGLDVGGINSVPGGMKALRPLKVALHTPGDAEFVLKNLGFDVTQLSEARVQDSLGDYDVLVNTFNRTAVSTRNAVDSFVRGGGGYVGIGPLASTMVRNRLLTFDISSGGARDNGIIRVVHNPATPVVANYPVASYGFVFRPGWFTSVGEGVNVAARIEDSDSWFMAGHWRARGTARGSAVIIYGDSSNGKVVLFGTEPVFRAHTEFFFRQVANAIFFAAAE